MNDPRKIFVDERLRGRCVFCGGIPDTRDHCPSKVLLDEPLPANLAVVAACGKCNQSFSKDEQYLACLLECVIHGSTDPALLRRANVRRILLATPHLAAQIQASMVLDVAGRRSWNVDMDRVRNVVIKLARGHLDYELSIQEWGDPDVVEIVPFQVMERGERDFFECPEPGREAVWPELGSRAFMRMLSSGDKVADGWLEVQDGRYRYLVGQTSGNFVHIALSEYLACRVAWE